MLIYIPLCLYQYRIRPDIFHFLFDSSTFHSVYISTTAASGHGRLDKIYIPLCLYQYYRQSEKVYRKNVSTFHSVYISTPHRLSVALYQRDLHSTLFILVPLKNLSISCCILIYIPLCLYQYAKTQEMFSERRYNLHSTLFILVLIIGNTVDYSSYIYIPLCLYQYHINFFIIF